MSQNKSYVAHYISGTHWDREWYRPFQEFRILLVQLLDELIDLMERSDEFKYFQLDGQTCILKDYLEIRPENKERLKKLIQDQRILIGPWFTMPDLFCVGAEALIRNLQMGKNICAEWGVKPMSVGFICDMFGHPSQMPQIFSGFGINDAVLGRGTNEETTPMFFEWCSPDGSKVLVFKLQDHQGYGAFAVPRTILEENTFHRKDLKDLNEDLQKAGNDPDSINKVKEQHFRKHLSEYVQHESNRAVGSTLCLMDAMDHIPPAQEVKRYIDLIGSACPEVQAQHSNLPLFFAEVRDRHLSLEQRFGELREPSQGKHPYLWLIPNCVSARVSIKLANDRCQALLEKWAEPLVAMNRIQGQDLPQTYLKLAWENVLLNQAHDSICGCSIDQVHRDMMQRFQQAQSIAVQVRYQAISPLLAMCRELGSVEHEFTVAIYNPVPTIRQESVTFDIDLPPDWPTDYSDGFNGQRLKCFILEDAEGQTIPYQKIHLIPQHVERSRFPKFCYLGDGVMDRYTVAATLTLPAMGALTIKVRPDKKATRHFGSLRTGPLCAENEHLILEIQNNGTIKMTDKKSKAIYSDLLLLEDRSETGDGWFHTPSINDKILFSSGCAAQISVIHDGPERVSFSVEVRLQAPKQYDLRREARSEENTELLIRHVITLTRTASTIDIQTTVFNCCLDHQLKLLMPTDMPTAKTYFAHHPFDFVERKLKINTETSNWQEMERYEKPFLNIQSIEDGNRGLAFISAGGLHEGGILDDQRRTMQVTLLRSFRKTVATSGENDGQEQGDIHYHYRLLPFQGSLDRQAALHQMDDLQAGLFWCQSGSRNSGFMGFKGTVSEFSLCQNQSLDVVISSIKPAEVGQGIILRLWNPSSKASDAKVILSQFGQTYREVNLAEEPVDNEMHVFFEEALCESVPAHTIKTYWIF